MENPFSLRLLNPLRLFQFIWHLPNFLKLFYRLFRDPRVPIYLKLSLIGGILYVVSPVDFLPDLLLPFIGGFDDLLIIIIVGKIFLSNSPQEVVLEHVARIDLEKQLKKKGK